MLERQWSRSITSFFLSIWLWKLLGIALELQGFTGTVQATGIAALAHAQIACNMAEFHEKSTQKNLRVNFYMSFYTQTVYMQIWVYFYGDWFCLRKYTQVACISLDVLFTTENVADLKISNRHCGKTSFRDERENKLLYTFSYYDHATIVNVVFCNQRFP